MEEWDRLKRLLTPRLARFLIEETGNPEQLGDHAASMLSWGADEDEVLDELRKIVKANQEKRLNALTRR